jgi:sigma-B regulation protein RsbU (phosphoserine phosphatase)
MSDDPPVMACMEVWGGNSATERSFSMLGLETWIYSKPYQQADGGGDVYYISRCATGRITRLLIADVSGHGAKVSEAGERLRDLMRRHVNHIEQRQFLAEMNREFGEVRHAGGFATAVAASFFSPDARIAVTNAGHPPPMIYRGETRQWAILDTDAHESSGLVDFPLGLIEGTEYGEIRFEASPGDLLVFYTDSLIESRSSAGELLGAQGLLQIMGQLDATRPEKLIDALLQKIAGLYPENLTDDDVTVLVCRPTGTGTSVPLSNRLLAPWLFIRGCVQALMSGKRLPLPEFTWENFGGSMFDFLSRGRRKK